MRTAIYIEDGVVQLVITPESKFEKNALAAFKEHPTTSQIFHGSFYDCRGGWTRQAHYYPDHYGRGSEDDDSLIIRTTKGEPEPQA